MQLGDSRCREQSSPNTSAPLFPGIYQPMINPSGARFLFLYRWREGLFELTRLYTANMDGSGLACLAKDDLVSHTTWKSDQEILAWARQRGQGDHYYLFRDPFGPVAVVGESELVEDGHPTYSPCGRYLLTDTYADRARRRRLLIYDTKEQRLHVLGAFYTPFRYSMQSRCDLHPRWKRDGTQVCFDAAFEGDRQVYVADIPLAAGGTGGSGPVALFATEDRTA